MVRSRTGLSLGVTSRTPSQLVTELFHHVATDDVSAAAALFADSVDFAVPAAPGVPWIPAVDSPEGMAEFFTLLPKHLDRRQFEVTKVLADDEDAVVLGHLVSTVRATGHDIVTRFAIHLGVRDGRIHRYHMYEDSWAVAQAVAGPA